MKSTNPDPARFYADTDRNGKERVQRIALMPFPLLMWIVTRAASRYSSFFSNSGNTDETIKSIVAEIEKRATGHGTAYISTHLRHCMQRICPKPCACGSPGLYVVGVNTYCSKCRPKGVQQRLRYMMRESEQKSRAIEEARKARDDRDLSLKVQKAGRNPRRHGR